MNNIEVLELLKVTWDINSSNIESIKKYRIYEKFLKSKFNSLEIWYGKHRKLGFTSFEIIWLLGVMNMHKKQANNNIMRSLINFYKV